MLSDERLVQVSARWHNSSEVRNAESPKSRVTSLGQPSIMRIMVLYSKRGLERKVSEWSSGHLRAALLRTASVSSLADMFSSDSLLHLEKFTFLT